MSASEKLKAKEKDPRRKTRVLPLGSNSLRRNATKIVGKMRRVPEMGKGGNQVFRGFVPTKGILRLVASLLAQDDTGLSDSHNVGVS